MPTKGKTANNCVVTETTETGDLKPVEAVSVPGGTTKAVGGGFQAPVDGCALVAKSEHFAPGENADGLQTNGKSVNDCVVIEATETGDLKPVTA